MSRQRAPEGPASPPPVQRLRICYAKRGRLRFSSTRDFQRALERALRRAGVPMAFSSGFHPHPRISYANAAPTGTASEAEYVEIAVVERLDPEEVRAALDLALPQGYDVIRVVDADDLPSGSLADALEASRWEITFADVGPQTVEALETAVSAYLALATAEVTRTMKSGPRTFDTRGAVVSLTVVGRAASTTAPGERDCAILHLVVRHTTPTVRPDDVLTAIRRTTSVDLPSPLVRRLAQGPLLADPVRVGDPLSTA